MVLENYTSTRKNARLYIFTAFYFNVSTKFRNLIVYDVMHSVYFVSVNKMDEIEMFNK